MASTILAPSQSKAYPSWNGPAVANISASLSSGTDTGSVEISSPSILAVPLGGMISDGVPATFRIQFWGCEYTITNTGILPIVVDTPLPPNP